jgi:hypothetical protein
MRLTRGQSSKVLSQIVLMRLAPKRSAHKLCIYLPLLGHLVLQRSATAIKDHSLIGTPDPWL